MVFKVKESLDVYVLVQKKRLAFLKYHVTIPFGRVIHTLYQNLGIR